MNFIGHHYHALEQKGRLAIPSIFREGLGDKIIITRGLETCLHVIPQKTWKKTVSEVPIHPFGKKSDRDWLRLITHNSQEVQFDQQGRVHIDTHLLKYANLSKNCIIAGSINYLEIWDQETYHQYYKKLEETKEEITTKKYE